MVLNTVSFYSLNRIMSIPKHKSEGLTFINY